jgi:hypothetical protein
MARFSEHDFGISCVAFSDDEVITALLVEPA